MESQRKQPWDLAEIKTESFMYRGRLPKGGVFSVWRMNVGGQGGMGRGRVTWSQATASRAKTQNEPPPPGIMHLCNLEQWFVSVEWSPREIRMEKGESQRGHQILGCWRRCDHCYKWLSGCFLQIRDISEVSWLLDASVFQQGAKVPLFQRILNLNFAVCLCRSYIQKLRSEFQFPCPLNWKLQPTKSLWWGAEDCPTSPS